MTMLGDTIMILHLYILLRVSINTALNSRKFAQKLKLHEQLYNSIIIVEQQCSWLDQDTNKEDVMEYLLDIEKMQCVRLKELKILHIELIYIRDALQIYPSDRFAPEIGWQDTTDFNDVFNKHYCK